MIRHPPSGSSNETHSNGYAFWNDISQTCEDSTQSCDDDCYSIMKYISQCSRLEKIRVDDARNDLKIYPNSMDVIFTASPPAHHGTTATSQGGIFLQAEMVGLNFLPRKVSLVFHENVLSIEN
jgi:hypothetical protein